MLMNIAEEDRKLLARQYKSKPNFILNSEISNLFQKNPIIGTQS